MEPSKLASLPFFQGISPEDVTKLLGELDAREVFYEKGSFLVHAGDKIPAAGLILSGEVHILREDFWGQSRFGGTNPARSLFRGNLCSAGHRSGSKRTGGVRHFCAILIPEPDTGAHRAAKSPFCPPLPPSAANIRRTESNAYSKDCPRHLPQHKGKAPVLPFLLRTGFRKRCFFHPL